MKNYLLLYGVQNTPREMIFNTSIITTIIITTGINQRG